MAFAMSVIGPLVADGGSVGSAAQAERNVRGYLENREGSYGVAFVNLLDQSEGGIDADGRYRMASMYKLLVMYRVMAEIHTGRLAPDASVLITEADAAEGEPASGLHPGNRVTIRAALDRMISVSSNAAAYALARRVGGWGAIRSVPEEIGLRNTYFDEYWWSTPADLLRFFRLLAERRLVSPAASEEMLAVLRRQTRDDRIPAGLPDSLDVAHKTGELEGVRNDGGLVEGAGVRYILVFMTRSTEPAVGIGTAAEVSRLVFEVFAAQGNELTGADRG